MVDAATLNVLINDAKRKQKLLEERLKESVNQSTSNQNMQITQSNNGQFAVALYRAERKLLIVDSWDEELDNSGNHDWTKPIHKKYINRVQDLSEMLSLEDALAIIEVYFQGLATLKD